MYTVELGRLLLDALCAIEGRDVAYVSVFDFTGGSIAKLLSVLEYTHAMSGVKKRVSPTPAGSITFMVNFPSYWKMVVDMVAAVSREETLCKYDGKPKFLYF